MSADWQAGDLALCVDASPCQCRHCPRVPVNLEVGRIYRVLAVVNASQISDRSHKWIGLDVGIAPSAGHGIAAPTSARFRKIRPDEHQGNIEDWELLLDSVTRKVSA